MVPVMVILALAATLAGTLSCGGGKGAKAPVTLRYMRWTDPAELAAARELLDLFHQRHPHITVTLEYNSWDQYWSKLQTLVAAGDPPDVFMMSGLYFAEFQSRGALADLSERVSAAGDLALDDFFELPRQAFSADGRLYAMPRDCNCVGLFYNRDTFDAAGVGYPDSTWTWETLRETARALTRDTNGDGRTDVWGYQVMNEIETSWGPVVYQNEGAILDAARTHCRLAEPPAVEAFTFLRDLIYKDRVSPNPAEMESMPGQAFRSGHIAMVANGSWMLKALEDAPELRYGVAPLPRGRRAATIANGVANALSAKSAHPDEAWELVRFLSGREAQEVLARSGTSIPVLKSVANSAVYLDEGAGTPEAKRVFIAAMAYAEPLPFTPGFARWYDEVRKALDLVWLGKTEPARALEDVVPKVDAVLSGKPL
jgi:multiple sugar transport system substrate-binding protein